MLQEVDVIEDEDHHEYDVAKGEDRLVEDGDCQSEGDKQDGESQVQVLCPAFDALR